MDILIWLNNNQGVITAAGLILAIPFSFRAGKWLESSNNKNNKEEIERILIHELWINLNYVSQIENSYIKNLTDKKGVHIPHYSPRISVLAKIVEFSLLRPLEYRRNILEIYAQLSELKAEFNRWRDFANSINLLQEKEFYKTQSSTLLSFIKPVMMNMLDIWCRILIKQPDKNLNPKLQQIKDKINIEIRKGRWVKSCYKSSDLSSNVQKEDNYDVIVCWIHDSKKISKEVIELRNMAALFDTWKD